MASTTRDPLAEAQAAALLLLSRMILWFWCPGIALSLAFYFPRITFQTPLTAALILLPLVGWFLRPAPSRPAALRATATLVAFGVIAVIALVSSGPRSLNVAMIAVLLSLIVLFRSPRTTGVALGVLALCAVIGIVLQAIGWMPSTSGEGDRPMPYRIVTALMAISALGYCASVSISTLRIYGVARQAAEDRLEELRQAREEAEALQLREVKATIATGMAHDLANIVQVMTSSADLLRDQPLDHEGHAALQEIEVIGERATSTLRALLTIGRATPTTDSHPVAVGASSGASSTSSTSGRANVRTVLGRLETLLRPLLGRRISLFIEVESPSAVSVDGSRLEQALLNLALNARDAMPHGGTLRITARDAGEEVLIAVTDTGTGLDPEIQARIFEPYFTTKAPGKGTGLGLAMVRRIMDQSDGRITVTSTLGEGTTFSLWFPRAR